MEDYRTIRGTAIGEYEEKKSRFIAQLAFADSEEKAVAFLEQVRAANRTARHNVYAYRLREGNRERYSDDGEPAKTAGTPALEVLQHSGLTDLIVVVTRYFGGVLLGTGGLVRAYTTATARALENAEVVTVRSVVELEVTVDYALYERAALLIHAAGAKLADPQFTDRVTLHWQMPEGTEPPLLEQLRAGMDTTPLHTGDLPPLDLYMDQVLAMLEERFQSGARQPGEKTITKTIINNYSKARLLQKPVGKKYTPEHLLVITLIQTLKQSLSLEDVGRLFAACPEFSGEGRYDAAAVHARYEDFERMKLSQEKLAEAIQENMKDCQAEDLFSQVLYLANLSGALSLTARRLIDTLPQPEKPGRGKKQPASAASR